MPAGIETFGNQPTGTVTSGGTTTSDTAFTVTATDSWPAAQSTATPNTFFRFVDQANTSEIMIATTAPGGSGSGQSWTVLRAQEGTTGIAHSANWTAVQLLTAGTFQNLKQASNASTTAVTVASTTETVLASYTPVAADIEAGTTFEAVAFGPLTAHGGSTRGTLEFNLYWGGSGAVGAAFTSSGSTLLASLLTGTNAPAFTATTVIAGASFDVNGEVILLSSTTAHANMNLWYQGGNALSVAGLTGTCVDTTTKGGASAAGPITISGSGPIILTGYWAAANFTTQSFTAVAPLIYRAA